MDTCPVCQGEEVRIEPNGAHWFCPECLGGRVDRALRAALEAARTWKRRAENQRERARRLRGQLERLQDRLDRQIEMRVDPSTGRN